MKPLYLILLAVAAVVLTGCYPEPVANFDYSYDDNTAPALVTFSNYSTDADEYRWDFGDGNVSTTMSPTHTYQEAGTYTITLLAKSRGGESNMTKSITITQPTTFKVRNSTSFTLYDVYSYYDWNGSDFIEEVYHGDLFSGFETQEMASEYGQRIVDFKFTEDGDWYTTVNPFMLNDGQSNTLILTDNTLVELLKSAPIEQSRSELAPIRGTGTEGKMKDFY